MRTFVTSNCKLIAGVLCAFVALGCPLSGFASERGAPAAGSAGREVQEVRSLTDYPAPGDSADGFVVKIKTQEMNAGIAWKAGAKPAAGQYFRVDRPEDALAFAAPAEIEYIEPNYTFSVLGFPADAAPDDPVYAQNGQWGLNGDYGVRAQSAWRKGLSGRGVTVAVIDSGINRDHVDFTQSNLLQGYNYTSGNGQLTNNDVADSGGHGTFVTSIIAAKTNNSYGMAGLAYDAKILPIKVMKATVAQNHGAPVLRGALIDVLAALGLVASRGDVDVVNFSIGDNSISKGRIKALQDELTKIVNKGIIVVAAAGNKGDGTLYYPAANDGVIGVGSINRNGRVSGFSERNASVDVVAPGEGIIGLSADGNSGIATGSGTSFAAPFVTGIAAIVKQERPSVDARQFKTILKSTAVDMGPPGRDNASGYGRVDLNKVLRLPASLTMNTMYKGLVTSGGHIYYFNSLGKMTAGWKTINGKRYRFSTKTGAMLTGFQTVGGKNYYFTKSGKDKGVLKTCGFFTADGKIYYANGKGVLAKGWKTVNGKRYYFDKNTSAALVGRQTIGGKNYYFSKSGVLRF